MGLCRLYFDVTQYNPEFIERIAISSIIGITEKLEELPSKQESSSKALPRRDVGVIII